MRISTCAFADLDMATAYAVWRLRQDVFVVEQACPYPTSTAGTPNRGRGTWWRRTRQGRVAGYARVLDDEAAWRIGGRARPFSAGRGWADELMRAALAECPGRDVVLDAQSPLAGWYASFGFAPDGPDFLEDGIPTRRCGCAADPPGASAGGAGGAGGRVGRVGRVGREFCRPADDFRGGRQKLRRPASGRRPAKIPPPPGPRRASAGDRGEQHPVGRVGPVARPRDEQVEVGLGLIEAIPCAKRSSSSYAFSCRVHGRWGRPRAP